MTVTDVSESSTHQKLSLSSAKTEDKCKG